MLHWHYNVRIILGQDAITSAIREIHRRRLSTQLFGIMGRLQNIVETGWRRGSVSRMECQPTALVYRFSHTADHLRSGTGLVTLAECK